MSSIDSTRHLGDYQLLELLVETTFVRRWRAKQISVGREVLVDELKSEHAARTEDFLADVRAKAAVDHPVVASMYEAAVADGHCFCAHELLAGRSLDERRFSLESMAPADLITVLRRLAEVHLQFEQQKVSTAALEIEHVHVDAHGVVRLENLALCGQRADDESPRDIHELGVALMPMVAHGKPGATRLLTMLSWMRGEGIEQPLNWQQIYELSGQVDQQLTAPPPTIPTSGRKRKLVQPVSRWSLIGIALALIIVVAGASMAVLLLWPSKKEPVLPAVVLPSPVRIANARQGSFLMSAHEVTIGQYREFVEVLATLEKTGRQTLFDHKEQPSDKRSHLPDDWSALLSAAKSGGVWNGRRLTLDAPVVGVDWWDAMAYADWKDARLPSWLEWRAAFNGDERSAAAIPVADWGPVNPATTDRTPQGVLNLSGSVAEWSCVYEATPVNPLGGKKWVLIGGSYLKPGSNAAYREWVDSRSLRRPDLGFRVVFNEQ